MLRRGLLALVPLMLVGTTACDPIVVIPDPIDNPDSKPIWDIANPGRQLVVEGAQFKITLTASDANGDAITYVLKQSAGDSMTINQETGEIVWTPDRQTITECKGTETFPVQVVARTKPGSDFVDSETLTFNIIVLGDLDADGQSDVDDTGAVVDSDIDGDGLANADETAAATDECVADTDDDDVNDGADNCKTDKNPKSDCDGVPATPIEQCDKDGDGLGDICDLFPLCALNDLDGDGVDDCQDNCLDRKNPKKDCDGVPATPIEQCDNDDDGIGDECDPCPKDKINDPDLDGLCAFDEAGNVTDNCNGDLNGNGTIEPDEIFTAQSDPKSAHFNTDQADDDSDDIGDVCDACPNDATNDEDEDGVCEDVDNCPNLKNEPSDCDNDPGTPDEQCDLDEDNIGDACDTNIDGDCKENSADNCPTVANCEADGSQLDTDEDTLGDACDPDDDDDTVLDGDDNCPLVANVNQVDVDDDGVGFQCDPSVVIPSALHANGLAAARVTGAARAGTTALSFEAKESPCNSTGDCPPPGVLVVDDADHLYMKRYSTGDADSAWLEIGFGATGELGDPFVSQAGIAYLPTLKDGSYGLRRIEGETAAAVFPTVIVTSDVTFHDLPDGTTAAQLKPGAGNPGLYHLEDLSSGDPPLLRAAAGSGGPPPLGPFEIPCGQLGCQTSLVDTDATKMGPFRGKDNTLYVPFVAAGGIIEVRAYTASAGNFAGIDVPQGVATTPLSGADVAFVGEDPALGTPWYCMRKSNSSGSPILVNVSAGLVTKYATTSFVTPCANIAFHRNPTSGVWFMLGPAPTAGNRLSFFDPAGTVTQAQDIFGPSRMTTDTLALHHAGVFTFIQRTRSDEHTIDPNNYSSIEFWPPGQATSIRIANSDEFLYQTRVATHSSGWIGVVGRLGQKDEQTQAVVARRFRSPMTTAEQTTLLSETQTSGPASEVHQAWVSAAGDVWGRYTTRSSSQVLNVFPSIGSTPGAGGLATSTVTAGGNVHISFHGDGPNELTIVSVKTTTFKGTLQYLVKSTSAAAALRQFSPAIELDAETLHDDFLRDLVPVTGGGNNWVTYADSTTKAYSIAKVVNGATPSLTVVDSGLDGPPSHVRIGPGSGNGKPWFSYEKSGVGFTQAWINGTGNFDPFVTGVEEVTEIDRLFNERPVMWGIRFKKTPGGATYVCRLPSRDECWEAIPALASTIMWPGTGGAFVSGDGIAHLAWIVENAAPAVTLWRSIAEPMNVETLP